MFFYCCFMPFHHFFGGVLMFLDVSWCFWMFQGDAKSEPLKRLVPWMPPSGHAAANTSAQALERPKAMVSAGEHVSDFLLVICDLSIFELHVNVACSFLVVGPLLVRLETVWRRHDKALVAVSVSATPVVLVGSACWYPNRPPVEACHHGCAAFFSHLWRANMPTADTHDTSWYIMIRPNRICQNMSQL